MPPATYVHINEVPGVYCQLATRIEGSDFVVGGMAGVGDLRISDGVILRFTHYRTNICALIRPYALTEITGSGLRSGPEKRKLPVGRPET
jgi:hypothetical protein